MPKRPHQDEVVSKHADVDVYKSRKLLKLQPPAGRISTKSFPFFRLPRELRDVIYDYALRGTKISFLHETQFRSGIVGTNGVACYGGGGPSKVSESVILPPWLHTSKGIEKEGLQLFYQRTWFYLGATYMRPSTSQATTDEKPIRSRTRNVHYSAVRIKLSLNRAQLITMVDVPAFSRQVSRSPERRLVVATGVVFLLRSLQCDNTALRELELGVFYRGPVTAIWNGQMSFDLLDTIPRGVRRYKFSFEEEAKRDMERLDHDVREKYFARLRKRPEGIAAIEDGVDGSVGEWTECQRSNGVDCWHYEATTSSYRKCR